jgi:phage/plasmid-associated DNA primase
VSLKKALLLKKIAVDYAQCSRCATNPHYEQIVRQIFGTPEEAQVLQHWPSVKGFACADGFYEITKEGEVIKKQPLKEHYIRTPLKFSPDANCPTPNYNKILNSVVNPECLEQLMGLILSNYLNKIQEVGTLFGVGGTGKGTITRVLTSLLPPDRITNLDFAQLTIQEKLFALADSVLNVVNEVTAKPTSTASTALSTSGVTKINAGYVLNTVGLKRATGGDLLQGRNLHKDHFTFYNPASFLMVFNTFPALDSSRDDLSRRLSNFIVEFVKPEGFIKDVNLEDNIRQHELPGVLHRWIEATKRFLKNGYDNEHSNGLYLRWLRSFDSVSGFVEEGCLITGKIGDSQSKVDLHRVYIQYCQSRSYAPVDFVSFCDEFAEVPQVMTEDRLGMPLKLRGNLAFGGLRLTKY